MPATVIETIETHFISGAIIPSRQRLKASELMPHSRKLTFICTLTCDTNLLRNMRVDTYSICSNPAEYGKRDFFTFGKKLTLAEPIYSVKAAMLQESDWTSLSRSRIATGKPRDEDGERRFSIFFHRSSLSEVFCASVAI